MNRNIIITCLITLACISCKSKSQIQVSTSSETRAEQNTVTLTLQDSLINYGRNYLRVPYRYGGTTSRGFDCSGFTSHVYKNFGYNLNRSSRDQATQFPSVQKRDLQTGDLVFFEGRRKNKVVGHVGIVTETKPNGEFDFIHASVQQGVIISSSTEAYYASRYLKAGRVIDNKNSQSYVRNSTRLPANSAAVSTAANHPVSQKKIVDAIYHTVKRGDNLASIAKKYDVPITTIQHLNNLPSKRIKRGQKLLITEAVNVPSMPLVEIQKIDFEKTVNRKEQQSVEPEERVKNEVNQSNIEQHNSSSEKLNRQDRIEIVVFDQNPVESLPTHAKHRVVGGESLSSIARKYNLTVDKLKSLNNLTSNNIHAGQILIVNASDAAVETAENAYQEHYTANSVIHTVKRGDTLYSIARQYNCSVADIRKWNENLGDAIQVGEKIKIFR
ncbi:MAG: LysM peptidoglycan-binding domain-containing protein [Porphyromonadaceae bacterium]|nr:LysM peptidoglycan-binding domain-containing protein [Porphyromonadaceae bacterium]